MKHPGSKSVGWALLQASRLHRARMGEKLARLGLYPGQEQVLQALAAEGAMTMGELAAMLRVRPPTASKTISRLSALGLVARQSRNGGAAAPGTGAATTPSPAEKSDARIVRVTLTDDGRTLAAAIAGLWDEVEAEMLDDLDGKDRKRLRKLLRKTARNLAAHTGSDAAQFDAADDDAAEEGAEDDADAGEAGAGSTPGDAETGRAVV